MKQPVCSECKEDLSLVESCPACEGGDEKKRCWRCDGLGALYACRNWACDLNVPTRSERVFTNESNRGTDSRPAPGGHQFEGGRCTWCGQLQMLVQAGGWRCKAQ